MNNSSKGLSLYRDNQQERYYSPLNKKDYGISDK